MCIVAHTYIPCAEDTFTYIVYIVIPQYHTTCNVYMHGVMPYHSDDDDAMPYIVYTASDKILTMATTMS